MRDVTEGHGAEAFEGKDFFSGFNNAVSCEIYFSGLGQLGHVLNNCFNDWICQRGGKGKAESGKWEAESGRRKGESGRWKVEGGKVG